MELDQVTQAALAGQAEREGVSVDVLVERIVIDAAREQLQADLSLIEEVVERSKRKRLVGGKVLQFCRPE